MGRPGARLTGVVYLLYFLWAIAAEVFFVNNPVLFITINLIAYSFYILLVFLFYYMFRPVNPYLSVLAAVCGLGGCIVGMLQLFHLSFSRLSPLAFFGPYCFLIGWLIFSSTFIPRILGILMILAGLSWMVFLTSAQRYLASYIEAIGILAEALLMIWLIVKGVTTTSLKSHQ